MNPRLEKIVQHMKSHRWESFMNTEDELCVEWHSGGIDIELMFGADGVLRSAFVSRADESFFSLVDSLEPPT